MNTQSRTFLACSLGAAGAAALIFKYGGFWVPTTMLSVLSAYLLAVAVKRA